MTDEDFAKSIGATLSDDEFAKSIGAVKAPDAPFKKQLGVALKQGAVASEDLINRAATGISAALADLFGQTEARDKMFKAMEADLAKNKQWANPEGIQPGLAATVLGTIPNIPSQMLTMPLQPFETGQKMIEHGESMPRAQAGQVLTGATNAIGMMPGVGPMGRALGTRLATGAGVNIAQTLAERKGLQALSQTEEGKQYFKPTAEQLAVAGLLGAGFGAIPAGKTKAKTPTPDVDVGAKIAAIKAKQTGEQVNTDPNAPLEFTKTEWDPGLQEYRPQEQGLDATNDVADFILSNRLTPEQRQSLVKKTLDPNATEFPVDADVVAKENLKEWATLYPEDFAKLLEHDSAAAQAAFDRMQQQDSLQIRGQKEALFNERPQTDDLVAQRRAEEEAKAVEEQGLLDLEQQLTDQAYKPQGDGQGPKTRAARSNRFGQGGAIDPDLLTLGLTRLFHGGREFKKWNPKTIGSGEGMKALGPGLYTGDNENLAKIYKKYGDDISFDDATGDMHITPGVVNELAVDMKNFFDYRKKPSEEMAIKIKEATQKLDSIGARASTRGIQSALGQHYDPHAARQAMIDSGIDGMWVDLGGNLGREIVIFNPEAIAQVSRVDTPVEKHPNISKFSQGGAIDPDLLTLGLPKLYNSIKTRLTGTKPLPKNTLETPQDATTIALKKAKAAKATAIGLKDSIYGPIGSLEEVKSYPARDITTTMQQMGSGMEGALRRNTGNKLLQYLSNLRTKAEANTNKDLRTYVTGEGGFNQTYAKLSTQDKVTVHNIVKALGENKMDYTPEIGVELGVSKTMDAFLSARQRMMDAEYNLGKQVDGELGIEHFDRLPGYNRANFDPTYKAIVGHWEGEGEAKRFIPYTILNAQTKFEFKKAKEWWAQHQKEKGLSNYEVKDLEPRGLNKQSTPMKSYDGLSMIFSKLAELNPEFAKAKAEVDSYIQGSTKKLGRYDLHALKKMGVEGAIGSKPWRDAEQNATDFFKSEVNSFDEGYQYWNYQKVINEIGKAIADPDLANQYPKTLQYLNTYRESLTGKGLNEFGALGNAVIGWAFDKAGHGSSAAPKKAAANLRKAASVFMMGGWNPGFIAIQMVQYLQAGIPESLRIAKDFDVNGVKAMGESLNHLLVARPWMEMAYSFGDVDKTPFNPEIKAAFKWMKEHGLTDYNEMALSHEAATNPTRQKVEDVLGHPMTMPEVITRPTMFLWYVDLMRSKLSGEELYTAAKRATDYTMTNYHSDEAPLLYQRSGVLGENIGGLKRYVHNAVDQMVARGMELKEYPGAFAATMGMTLLLQGITGLMGYDVADQLSQTLTDKPLRHWLEQVVSSPDLMNGVLSAQQGLDIQNRFSLAGILPSDGQDVMQTAMGPHFSKLLGMGGAAINYAKNPDAQSFNELVRQYIPSGMYGLYEDKVMTDEEGFVLNKEGQRKYTEPRSVKERAARKLLNIRPLSERLQDEELYAENKVTAKFTGKKAEAVSRMKAAINFKDTDGFDEAYLDYIEAEGDPAVLKRLYNLNAKQKNLSAKQREIMTPGKSVGSVKKYKRYWEE